MSADQAPLACCLSTADYQSRIAWIAHLTRTALRRHIRDDLVLHLFCAQDSALDVRTMVEQERICCGFLIFDLNQRSDVVCVTITAPETARKSVDVLFEPFLGGLSADAHGD